MAVTTLLLLSHLTSNISPDQMGSLWTGWAGGCKYPNFCYWYKVIHIQIFTMRQKHILWLVNVVHRNLYWADSKLRRIEVALLDGRYRKHLIRSELGYPSAVAVNPRLGWDWFDSNWPDRLLVKFCFQLTKGIVFFFVHEKLALTHYSRSDSRNCYPVVFTYYGIIKGRQLNP